MSDAATHARLTIDAARRRHQVAAFDAMRHGDKERAKREAAAVARLQRYGPSETLVVSQVFGDPAYHLVQRLRPDGRAR